MPYKTVGKIGNYAIVFSFIKRGEKVYTYRVQSAGVAELVYALVLGTSAARLGSSSLPSSTMYRILCS